MIKSYNKTTQFMSAALTVGFFDMVTNEAFAGTFTTYTNKMSNRTASPFANTVAFICYMGGFALAAMGVVALKQHVENPGQAPLKNGLAKLGFGGMLLALPPVVSAIQGTANAGDTTTNLQKFGVTGISG